MFFQRFLDFPGFFANVISEIPPDFPGRWIFTDLLEKMHVVNKIISIHQNVYKLTDSLLLHNHICHFSFRSTMQKYNEPTTDEEKRQNDLQKTWKKFKHLINNTHNAMHEVGNNITSLIQLQSNKVSNYGMHPAVIPPNVLDNILKPMRQHLYCGYCMGILPRDGYLPPQKVG